MKKILLITLIVTMILFNGCRKDNGGIGGCNLESECEEAK